MPSTLTRTDHTLAGMDNSDYTDKSSLSSMKIPHYAALDLSQDATLNKPKSKRPVSETGINRSDTVLETTLPCQEVPHTYKQLYDLRFQKDAGAPRNKTSNFTWHGCCTHRLGTKIIFDQSGSDWGIDWRLSHWGCSTHNCSFCCSTNNASQIPPCHTKTNYTVCYCQTLPH